MQAATEIVESMLRDNFAKKLQSTTLLKDTVARRLGDTAQDIQCEVLTPSKISDDVSARQIQKEVTLVA